LHMAEAMGGTMELVAVRSSLVAAVPCKAGRSTALAVEPLMGAVTVEQPATEISEVATTGQTQLSFAVY